MELWTYMSERFDLSSSERIVAWRLMRVDGAVRGAFADGADYSVGDDPRWYAAALDAAQVVASEARYLLADLHESRDDLTSGERAHLLTVAGELRAKVADLRQRAARVAARMAAAE